MRLASERVHHRHPQHRPPVENRRRDPAGPFPVVAWPKLAIQRVTSDVTEAENVRFRLVKILEVPTFLDGFVEEPSGAAEMIVQLTQAARAKAVDREPQLEHVGATGALKAPSSLIEDPGGLAG